MSAISCLAFYGLRFPVKESEIEDLEARTHPKVVAARKSGLKFYWGNFGVPGERNYLFIGANLGILGPENENEVSLSGQDLVNLLAETEKKLKFAGFSDQPALYFQLMPDV